MSKIEYEKIGKRLSIFKPVRSPFWWVRLGLPEHPNKELRQSLKTKDKYDAIFLAKRFEQEIDIKLSNNIDIITSKPYVTKLINLAIEKIKNKKPYKVTYNGYIELLKRDFIPYFENVKKLKIDELDRFKIEDYFNYVDKQSQTQVNMTKTCFKYIFEEALRHKYLKEHDVPKMPKVELKEAKQKRDFFNETELATVLYSFSEWISGSRKQITKENRFLLLAYSFFCIGSGVRPGNELSYITWNDLEIVERDKVKILTCKIRKGKTEKSGGRTIVLDYDSFKALNLMAKYAREGFEGVWSDEGVGSAYFKMPVNYYTDVDVFEELKDLQSEFGDRNIFARCDGKRIDFSKTFEHYIKWLRKEKGFSKTKNHTLYSFRHTYITTKLLNKEGAEAWTAEQVAAQCGNSLQMIWDFYLHLQTLDKVFNFKYYNELRKQNFEEEDTFGEIFKHK